jgi:hypothetical protein
VGLELPALVGCDLLGTAETSNPDGNESFSDCLGGDVRGSASGQLLYLSMEVRQYTKPEETGSSPTRSICT